MKKWVTQFVGSEPAICHRSCIIAMFYSVRPVTHALIPCYTFPVYYLLHYCVGAATGSAGASGVNKWIDHRLSYNLNGMVTKDVIKRSPVIGKAR